MLYKTSGNWILIIPFIMNNYYSLHSSSDLSTQLITINNLSTPFNYSTTRTTRAGNFLNFLITFRTSTLENSSIALRWIQTESLIKWATFPKRTPWVIPSCHREKQAWSETAARYEPRFESGSTKSVVNREWLKGRKVHRWPKPEPAAGFGSALRSYLPNSKTH